MGEKDENGNYIDTSDLKANRFAAEFLVDENLLRQEMTIYSIFTGKIKIKDIFKLASLFTVPYKTMVRRLYEIDAISKTEQNDFLAASDDTLSRLQKRYSLTFLPADNRVVIDNLVELAVMAYEQNKITYEKLEYLLSISGLEPKDLDIEKPISIVPPTDDELESIMEEDE